MKSWLWACFCVVRFGVEWVLFLPWRLREWSERNDTGERKGHGGFHGDWGEFGAFGGVIALILLVCFLPAICTEAMLISRLGESPMAWETRRLWFTVGFWTSTVLIAWLVLWVIGYEMASSRV